MKFKRKKRCEYCAHVLGEDKLCHNPKCVAVKLREIEERKKAEKEKEQEKAKEVEKVDADNH